MQTTHADKAGVNTPVLNLDAIPRHLHAQARAWYERQMAKAAAKHGDRWPEYFEWVHEYLEEELRQHLKRKGGRHGL